jgi:hypothetical protein
MKESVKHAVDRSPKRGHLVVKSKGQALHAVIRVVAHFIWRQRVGRKRRM